MKITNTFTGQIHSKVNLTIQSVLKSALHMVMKPL